MVTHPKNRLRRKRLQERDFDALEHVGRYRMGTIKGLMRAQCFEGLSQHAARKVLESLVGAGYAGKAAIFSTGRANGLTPEMDSGSEKYYYLTQSGARLVEQARSMRVARFGPLRGHEKVRAYAIYSFCCLADIRREKLTVEEVWGAFPQLQRRGESPSYYLEEEAGRARLMTLKVDARRNASRIDQVVSAVRLEVRRRCTQAKPGSTQPWEAWRRFIRQGHFGVTVKVFAVPYLMDLICPPRR